MQQPGAKLGPCCALVVERSPGARREAVRIRPAPERRPRGADLPGSRCGLRLDRTIPVATRAGRSRRALCLAGLECRRSPAAVRDEVRPPRRDGIGLARLEPHFWVRIAEDRVPAGRCAKSTPAAPWRHSLRSTWGRRSLQLWHSSVSTRGTHARLVCRVTYESVSHRPETSSFACRKPEGLQDLEGYGSISTGQAAANGARKANRQSACC
jgi:hypothetical protein